MIGRPPRYLPQMPSSAVFVSSLSFGSGDPLARRRLDSAGYSVVYNPLGRRLTALELAELAHDASVIVAGTDDLSEVVKTSKNLRLIARLGVGLDGIPVEICEARGIVISTTPDAVTVPVAELAVGIMLACERRICLSDRQIRGGGWPRGPGRAISELTVGIVGFGRIGRAFSERLLALRPKTVLVSDPLDVQAGSDQSAASGVLIHQVDLEQLLSDSDVVSLHLPLTDSTRGLINDRTLSLMKADATLINTARGELVDEAALIRRLQDCPEFSAGLDVFENEPYVGPLTGFESVVLSSHVGSVTTSARAAIDNAVVDSTLEWLQRRAALDG